MREFIVIGIESLEKLRKAACGTKPPAEVHSFLRYITRTVDNTPWDHWRRRKKPYRKMLRGQKPRAAFSLPLHYGDSQTFHQRNDTNANHTRKSPKSLWYRMNNLCDICEHVRSQFNSDVAFSVLEALKIPGSAKDRSGIESAEKSGLGRPKNFTPAERDWEETRSHEGEHSEAMAARISPEKDCCRYSTEESGKYCGPSKKGHRFAGAFPTKLVWWENIPSGIPELTAGREILEPCVPFRAAGVVPVKNLNQVVHAVDRANLIGGVSPCFWNGDVASYAAERLGGFLGREIGIHRENQECEKFCLDDAVTQQLCERIGPVQEAWEMMGEMVHEKEGSGNRQQIKPDGCLDQECLQSFSRIAKPVHLGAKMNRVPAHRCRSSPSSFYMLFGTTVGHDCRQKWSRAEANHPPVEFKSKDKRILNILEQNSILSLDVKFADGAKELRDDFGRRVPGWMKLIKSGPITHENPEPQKCLHVRCGRAQIHRKAPLNIYVALGKPTATTIKKTFDAGLELQVGLSYKALDVITVSATCATNGHRKGTSKSVAIPYVPRSAFNPHFRHYRVADLRNACKAEEKRDEQTDLEAAAWIISEGTWNRACVFWAQTHLMAQRDTEGPYRGSHRVNVVGGVGRDLGARHKDRATYGAVINALRSSHELASISSQKDGYKRTELSQPILSFPSLRGGFEAAQPFSTGGARTTMFWCYISPRTA
ncbi:hypothetical protein B0H19DRAFT_1083456 [Mycena capillaripes]|nr:hypothetical protein B0H19DRAFT_1083456 [Mycena capillaripes]